MLFAWSNMPSFTIWARFGSKMRRVLALKGNLRLLNHAMAALLVLSLYRLLTSV
jgi:threonine/homoserine/homoserine lactone efflux protein